MKKVFLGLSGGVDSSVAALLLKEAGFDVTGVFIKVWHPPFLPCDWRAEMRDAMRVCAKLDIKFEMLDLEKEYKEGIIDYMVEEYKIGRTPNPDVMCNRKIKFGAFLKYAMENGADYVATGHYAQNKDGLYESKDGDKDQTYFLWNVEKGALPKILFPIGNLEKGEVRKIAGKNKLNTAMKKDSQGLCFIGHVDMKEFLKRFVETEKGDVLNMDGDVIGEHGGTILYTLGERHGFKIFHQEVDEKPLYVFSKNLEKNTITVSEKVKEEEKMEEVRLSSINLLEKPENEVMFRARYRQSLQKASVISVNDTELVLKFDEPQDFITPGQSMVIYSVEKDGDGNRKCFGGGVIEA